MAWLLLDRLIRLGLGLVVGIWMARYLGPENFGILNIGLAVSTIGGVFVTLGMQQIITREICNNPSAANQILSTAAFISVITGFLVYFCIYILSNHYLDFNDVTIYTVMVISSLILFKFGDLTICWFEAKVVSKYVVWVQNIVFITFSGIKLYGIMSGYELKYFLWIILIEASLSSIALFLILYFKTQFFKISNINMSQAFYMVRQSMPLFLATVSIELYTRIDQVMLAKMTTESEVGLYAAATRLTLFWYFIPTIVTSTFFPKLIELVKKNSYEGVAQRLFDAMVLIALLIAVPVTFISDFVTYVLFGDAFIGAGSILSIHIWTSLFVFLGVLSGKILVAKNLQNLILQRSLLGLIANIILNLYLIPIYDGVGAALATLLTAILVAYFFDAIQEVTRRIFIMKTKALFFPITIRRMIINSYTV